MSYARPGVRHVFVRDMVLQAAIGVYPHEQRGTQRVRVNVDLAVEEAGAAGAAKEAGAGPDRLDLVLNYERVVDAVRGIVGAGHVKLVETLAERVAAACLGDPRVLAVRVRVEKLDVFADTGSVGVEVERRKSSTGTD